MVALVNVAFYFQRHYFPNPEAVAIEPISCSPTAPSMTLWLLQKRTSYNRRRFRPIRFEQGLPSHVTRKIDPLQAVCKG